MKVAVVTGTSSGLGEKIAKDLLEQGWKVYGCSRRGNAALAREPRYIDIKTDLSDMKQIEQIVSRITDNTINLLISNAGVVRMEHADQWSEETFKTIFNTNYIAPILLLNALRSKIVQVLTVLSDSSHLGGQGLAIYGSSKAALWLHMKSFAEENRDISVINLHPGAFDSPIIDDTTQEMMDEREEMMTIKDVSTVILQIATGVLSFPSGASIFLHNDWEAEEIALLHQDEYLYNVDTETLKHITVTQHAI